MADLNDKIVWPGWETVRLIGRGSFGAVYEIERDVFGHKEKAALNKRIKAQDIASDIIYQTSSLNNTGLEALKKGIEKSL